MSILNDPEDYERAKRLVNKALKEKEERGEYDSKLSTVENDAVLIRTISDTIKALPKKKVIKDSK